MCFGPLVDLAILDRRSKMPSEGWVHVGIIHFFHIDSSRESQYEASENKTLRIEMKVH